MHPLIAQLLARAGAFLPAAPMPTAWPGPTAMSRDRTPNSNAGPRRRDGIPHGTPGAKLARRAMKQQVGTIGPSGYRGTVQAAR
jgi:hypothetical protein